VKHIPLEFWARWNAELKRAAPDAMFLGELLDGDPSVVADTWTRGGFTSMFDFPLGFSMGDVFCRGESPAKLAAVLTNDRRYPDPSKLVTMLDNHDLPRVMSVCGGDVEKVRSALAFLLTTRGVPSLIWGTESGLDGAKEPDNRKSMSFAPHPLQKEIAFWLKARREQPALDRGVPVVISATADGVVVGRVSANQLAVITVGRDGVRPPLPSAPWSQATNELQAPAGASRTVGVFVSPVKPGAFQALVDQLEPQWRRGAKTRAVTFEGPAGAWLVGSGPELGDWTPAKAKKLPRSEERRVGKECRRLCRSRWSPYH
jgi:glycosidase